MSDSYSQLLDRISEAAKIEVAEIERKIEAKRAKLSGLVSREGAAQIVAAELGVNLDQEKLKISELMQGMKRANVLGKITEIFPVREFNKNGREGKVVRMLIADESSNVPVVLWDTNHIALVENKTLSEGDVIEVSNANVRNGELHLSSFADIKKSKAELGEVVTGKVFSEKPLSDVKSGEKAKIRGVVVQVYEPRYFEINPETGRKPTQEERDRGVKLEKRALLNFVIDDGSESIRCVVFGDEIKKLGLTDEEIFSLDKFEEKKNNILGSEMYFSGNMRQNQLYNTNEFTIEGMEEVNVDELIKELEAKQS